MCQVWLKLAQHFWWTGVLNFVNVYSLFCNYLPLEKCVAYHLNKFESLLPKGCFVPSLFDIGLVVLEKKMKMWKVYRRTVGRCTTDDRRSEKLTNMYGMNSIATQVMGWNYNKTSMGHIAHLRNTLSSTQVIWVQLE